MSLLLEALKALADRTAPAADAEASSTPAPAPAPANAAASIFEIELNPAKADLQPEELLENASAAVAESLSDAPPAVEFATASPAAPTSPAAMASSEEVSAAEPDFDWASIWQQAVTEPAGTEGNEVSEGNIASHQVSAADSHTEPAENTSESESVSPADERISQEMGEKMQYIFAPWFAAHGLANEPENEVSPLESPTASASSTESVSPTESETVEQLPTPAESAAASLVPESIAVDPQQVADAPDALHHPSESVEEIDAAPLEPQVAQSPPDPTWELHDRVADFATAWKIQARAEQSAEQASTADAIAQVPVEYRPHMPELKDVPSVSVESRPLEAATPKVATPEVAAPREQFVPGVTAQPVDTARELPVAEAPRPPAASVVVPPAAPSVTTRPAVAVAPPQPGEIRVSEPYLRLANRLLQALRATRPQAIVLAAADEASVRAVDVAQLAKAITLSEEGNLLVIQAHRGRPELGRRLGIQLDRHPRWQLSGGGELADRILCSSQGRIDLLPQENLSRADQAIDPLLLARCKRHYPLVLMDVGVVSSEIAQNLAPQGDAAMLVAVLQHTAREVAAQSTSLLRRLGVRTAGCVLIEPRPAA